MPDEKIMEDLRDAVIRIGDVRLLLDRLYYLPEFTDMFNRPVISMLIQACDYLSSNIDILKEKYRLKS